MSTPLLTFYKKNDKDKWFMGCHEVNAYYSPNYNEFVIQQLI